MNDVVRFDAPESSGVICSTLYLASCEPPADPESRIVERGGLLLAEADPERVAWRFTAVGLGRTEAEARGERRREIYDEISDELRGEAEEAWAEANF